MSRARPVPEDDMSEGHGAHHAHGEAPTQHGSHSWHMVACRIPMIAIAVVLVAIHAVGPGFLLVALACTAMMALMIDGGMDHGH